MISVRKIGASTAALVAALGFATFSPAEAEAACGAKGRLATPSELIRSPENGRIIGSLDVYYSNGTYSACVEHRGKKSRGTRLFTYVSMGWCMPNFCMSLAPGIWEYDRGYYRYHAGPISLKGNCLSIHGAMDDPYSGKRVEVAMKGVGSGCNFSN